jgi:hypothetical protein
VMTWQEQNNISSTSGQAEAAQPIAQWVGTHLARYTLSHIIPPLTPPRHPSLSHQYDSHMAHSRTVATQSQLGLWQIPHGCSWLPSMATSSPGLVNVMKDSDVDIVCLSSNIARVSPPAATDSWHPAGRPTHSLTDSLTDRLTHSQQQVYHCCCPLLLLACMWLIWSSGW